MVIAKRRNPKGKPVPVTRTRTEGGGATPSSSSSTTTLATPLSTTRVCIKNLPPTFTDHDVRDYVWKQLTNHPQQQHQQPTAITITDCRLLKKQKSKIANGMNNNNSNTSKNNQPSINAKSRRVAFVGFATAEMAAWCIQRLHRSYCHTVRLTAEYAHLPPATAAAAAKAEATAASSDDRNHTERATNHVKDVSDSNKNSNAGNNHLEAINDMDDPKVRELQRKKQEFLAIMGVGGNNEKTTVTSSQGNKFWANDDDNVAMGSNDADHANQAPNDDDDDDNDDSTSGSSYSTSPASNDDDDGDTDRRNSRKGPSFSSSAHKQIDVDDDDDMNFLKSKQVALDDLDQDDGDEAQDASQADNEKAGDHEGKDMHVKDDDSTSTSSNSRNNVHGGVDQGERMIDNGSDDVAENSSPNIDQEDQPTILSIPMDPKRLFIRNLPFSATEEEIAAHFERYGAITECHIPVDDRKQNKGYAFLTFDQPDDAKAARSGCDGTDFQGRLLHILPAQMSQQFSDADAALGHDPPRSYKAQLHAQRQAQALQRTQGLMASFVRSDAVVDTIAGRLGLQKGDLLAVKDGLSSGDAAVRLALGETAVLEENRSYFAQHGIDMDALISSTNGKVTKNEKDRHFGVDKTTESQGNSVRRSKTALLVKNLPHDTTQEELFKVFGSTSGTTTNSSPSRILLPPSHTIALVEYAHANDAKRAFRRLAYRRFKSVPLYLEWAPLLMTSTPVTASSDIPFGESSSNNNHDSSSRINNNNINNINNNKRSRDQDVDKNDEGRNNATDIIRKGDDNAVEEIEEVADGPTATIYVKNLNFATTEDQLYDLFAKHVDAVRHVRIPKKTIPVKRIQTHDGSVKGDEQPQSLSMGYAFIQVDSVESLRRAIKSLQGYVLDGHALELMPSKQSQLAVPRDASKSAVAGGGGDGKKNPTKLMIRNVPFQATRTELLKLFGSFGQLKMLRLPKKFDGSHRGFAFLEYRTSKEASLAMQALSKTHLYGRHLVLEWATTEEDTPNAIAAANVSTLQQVVTKSTKQSVVASIVTKPKSKRIKL